MDAKLKTLTTDQLVDVFTTLRAKPRRDRDEAMVLGAVANELERRLGEDEFDAFLDRIEG